MDIKNSKIALVHDFLLYLGGAEKTLQVFCEMFPDAPIYTLLKNDDFCKKYFPGRKIHTSFLQKFPGFIRKHHSWLLPLMPIAPENFNLREFDLVISSSSAFAKGIIVKPKTTHIAYIHAPMRYVWDWQHEYSAEKLSRKVRIFARAPLNYLRLWDRASAERPDYLLANSDFTAKRIAKYYRRDSEIIYPPVETAKFKPTKENRGYFLTVSRLTPYKRVDLIAETFLKLKLPLKIVGAGGEKSRIEKVAKNSNGSIELLGFINEEELINLYQGARAFVMAAEDDFNITCIEAMAAGKPVIALKKGGVAETIIEGVTGEFFSNAKLEMIADGVRRFIENEKKGLYDINKIRSQAEKFNKENFKKNILEFISKAK